LNPSKISQHFSKLRQQLSFQKFDKNENIGEHGICNFSNIFFEGRKIVQGGGKILPKVSPKFLGKCSEFKISPNPQH